MDLSNCHFCDSSDVEFHDEHDGGMAGSSVNEAWVECNNCKACGPKKDDWDNKQYKEQAITLWNKG